MMQLWAQIIVICGKIVARVMQKLEGKIHPKTDFCNFYSVYCTARF